jgi:hypothetical protein
MLALAPNLNAKQVTEMVNNDCQLLIHKRGEALNMDTEPVIRWYKKLGENKYAQAFNQDYSQNPVI